MLKRFKTRNRKDDKDKENNIYSTRSNSNNSTFSKQSTFINTPPSTSTSIYTTSNLNNQHHHSNTFTANTTLKIQTREYTTEQTEKLKNTIIYPNTPETPYGIGNDKLFGIENYGYICYISSIFQILYHIPEFRQIMLTTPNDKKVRYRKFHVPGKYSDKIPTSINALPNNNNNNNNGNNNGNGGSINSANITLEPKKHGIFNRNNESSTESIIEEPLTPIYKQNDFGISINHQDVQLREELIKNFPSISKISINYFLNTQKNINLVGIIKDPNATLEWRKKASLINGPIINLDESYSEEYGMNENLFTALKDSFECIVENESKTGVLSPYRLLNIIKRENIMFNNVQHQDAHEFLNFLINNLIEIEPLINDIFQGDLTSETKCLNCDNLTYRMENFLDLSIDLESNSSISNCLNIFSQIEMLNENNKFYCENCYSYQEAAKSIKIKKLPKILTFHLKRFKYSEKLGRLVKLFYRIEYMKTLKISNFTKDSVLSDVLFELYGIVVHIGGGPYHGHYVSLVKTEIYGWLLFDDESIEKVNDDYIFKFFGDGIGLSTAYLLFYKKIDNEEQYINDCLYRGDAGESDMDDVSEKVFSTPPPPDSSFEYD